MRPAARYEEPFYWWGPGWETPEPRALRELLRDGTIDCWTAAHVWAALARRWSLVVVAGPSGIGKTTLLTALSELLPEETRCIYLRGCFEQFAFLRDETIDPRRTALLVNEFSPHLPVYLWGPGVAEVLGATQRGFMLLATAHASSGVEFVRLLAGSPLRLAPDLIAAVNMVVAIGDDEGTSEPNRRRVTGVWRLAATGRGTGVDQLPPTPSNISQQVDSSPWFPEQEIDLRMRHLMNFSAGNEPKLAAVDIALEEKGSAFGGVAP